MTTDEVVIGDTGRNLVLQSTGQNGQAKNLSGGTSRLQGASDDVTKTINVVGTLTDPVNGESTWSGLGGTGYLVAGDLGAKPQATFTMRHQFTDAASKVLTGPEFILVWKKPVAI